MLKVSDGSGFVNKQGYRIVSAPGHPNAIGREKRIISEHVLVMSRVIERPLRKGETVHHKNGIRDDNRPKNLELWNTAQPAGQRVIDKLDFAVEMIGSYPEMLTREHRECLRRAL
jgi:hypothetical protein